MTIQFHQTARNMVVAMLLVLFQLLRPWSLNLCNVTIIVSKLSQLRLSSVNQANFDNNISVSLFSCFPSGCRKITHVENKPLENWARGKLATQKKNGWIIQTRHGPQIKTENWASRKLATRKISRARLFRLNFFYNSSSSSFNWSLKLCRVGL